MKRFFDIILSGFAILCLSPLLIPVVIILKLTGEHYIFYTQERIGRGGKPFGLLKFATMLKNSPNMGTGDITTKSDPRVLPFGRILRKTKINELPQLFNIFLGDMSIIGPRPLTPRNYGYYSPEVKKGIEQLTPGLSGIGSVIFRDEESIMARSGMNYTECYKTRVSPYKGALELWYLEHKNLWVDFKIIFLTAWVILFPKSRLPFKWFKDLPAKPDWMEE
ncbi:MAG: sugar transferase [Lentisphaeria bacterium]|nr:sugar transferase [Lentisphaeria bacterium]